jgi:hypothetical protein
MTETKPAPSANGQTTQIDAEMESQEFIEASRKIYLFAVQKAYKSDPTKIDRILNELVTETDPDKLPATFEKIRGLFRTGLLTVTKAREAMSRYPKVERERVYTLGKDFIQSLSTDEKAVETMDKFQDDYPELTGEVMVTMGWDGARVMDDLFKKYPVRKRTWIYVSKHLDQIPEKK